jgi:hypothetical protein
MERRDEKSGMGKTGGTAKWSEERGGERLEINKEEYTSHFQICGCTYTLLKINNILCTALHVRTYTHNANAHMHMHAEMLSSHISISE